MLATIAAVLGIFYAVLFLIAGSIIYSRIMDNQDLFNRTAAAVGLLRTHRGDHREPATI